MEVRGNDVTRDSSTHSRSYDGGLFSHAESHSRQSRLHHSGPPALRFDGVGGVTLAFGSLASSDKSICSGEPCQAQTKENTGHFVEVVFALAQALVKFNAEQNQRNLHLVRNLSTLLRKPSERFHIVRRRPFSV